MKYMHDLPDLTDRRYNKSDVYGTDLVSGSTTGCAAGALVERPEDIAALVKVMRQYRGQIEGGICVRRREVYLEETERRYFMESPMRCV